ncbi:deazaflavin-dependent nitroreductase family protein [Mycobacteroides abscessus subsp. abscessus]|nr:deazaflavin-dependent nitroreductase family protein [Mycobacteroides abscessus subsp. abscessus]
MGGQFEGFPLMLLTSIGAKSGAERVNPLAYFDIDGKAYIVGSSAGRPTNPAWVANLRANPHVEVEIGANPKASAIVKQRAPGFAEYEAATDRVIPVFEIQLA